MAERDLLDTAPPRELSDEELRGVLRSAVRTGIRGYREADLMLATICADHLFNRLRLAGVVVQRRNQSGINPIERSISVV